MEMEEIIKELDENGVVVIKNEIQGCKLDELEVKYKTAWNEIKSNWNSLEFKKRLYHSENITPLHFLGQDLYKNHLIAKYNSNESEIIDMGNKRYDFTYGLYDSASPSVKLDAIMKQLLRYEYNCYFGGLPVEKDTTASSQGFWHRDAYSLFGDEAVDIKIPPWYFTCLFAFEDSPEDIGTEFMLGTHKMNFKTQGVTDQGGLARWCEMNYKSSKVVSLKRGDLCIFNGLTLHRGRNNMNNSEDTVINERDRHMIYGVYSKNWYFEDSPLNHYYE
jgi:ectoine hydroxylase-related dioxygenase (phytanoyl-CoA dioxygenase family)